MLSFNEGTELLVEIEQAFPVAEWKAEGIRLWPLFRSHLFHLSVQPPARSRRWAQALRRLTFSPMRGPLPGATGTTPFLPPRRRTHWC